MFHDLYFDSGPCSGSIDSRLSVFHDILCQKTQSDDIQIDITERWSQGWLAKQHPHQPSNRTIFFRQLFDRISCYTDLYLYCFDWVRGSSLDTTCKLLKRATCSGVGTVEQMPWNCWVDNFHHGIPWIMMPLTSGKSQLGPTIWVCLKIGYIPNEIAI